MKVAHAVVCTPGRCGLYETTRELVAGLRKRGVDSRMVDPTKDTNKLHPKGSDDRGAPFAEMEWALEADVLVNHSGYDGTPLEGASTPVVHIAHGRPRSSFLSERDGSTPIYSYHYKKNSDPRFRSVVTFWSQHEPYLRVMFPDKPVHVVQSSVDLERWKPGNKKYDFHGKGGRVNVVCTDAWRDDVDPFIPLNAFALWAREIRGAKLHLYAAPKQLRGWSALIKRIQDDGNMGEILGWASGLEHVYRSADLMLTGNEIDTRSVRESMACGCPVVRANIQTYRSDFARAIESSRDAIRMEAIRRFDPDETARQFEAVL